MEHKTWAEYSKLASDAIEDAKSASESYDDHLEEIMRPMVVNRTSSTGVSLDPELVSKYISELDNGMSELQKLLVTANSKAIYALFALMQANIITLENPQKLNLILDDNNFLKLANLLEPITDTRFAIFFNSCQSTGIISLLERMFAITKKKDIYTVNMDGMCKLIDIIKSKLRKDV